MLSYVNNYGSCHVLFTFWMFEWNPKTKINVTNARNFFIYVPNQIKRYKSYSLFEYRLPVHWTNVNTNMANILTLGTYFWILFVNTASLTDKTKIKKLKQNKNLEISSTSNKIYRDWKYLYIICFKKRDTLKKCWDKRVLYPLRVLF